MPVLLPFVLSMPLAAQPAGASHLPPASVETAQAASTTAWTFASAKERFEGEKSRKPAAGELLGRWKLEADLREPGSKDRLALFKRLAKFEKVFAAVSFDKPYDKTPGAVMLTLTAPADLFQDAAKLRPSLGLKLAPGDRALAGDTAFALRRFEGKDGFLTTDIDLKWAVACRLAKPDLLLCRTDWAYKLYHWDLEGSRCGVCDKVVAANGLFWPVAKGKSPKIKLDEKPVCYMVFSRTK